MNSYIPKPWHFFLVPTPLFAIGLFSIYKTWDTFGWIMIVLGIITTGLITWALIWDVLIRKTDAIRYLFDSAKYLDRDRTNDLLIALGLKPMPERSQQTTITIDKRDQHGALEQTRIIPDVPISNEQLVKLAHGLIYEGAPFSRREWADKRGVMTDTQYRNLHSTFLARGLIEPKDPKNLNNGYVLTQSGREMMQQYALPSPSPLGETVLTP